MATILSLPIWSPVYFGYPYTVTPQWKTLSSRTESGKVQLRVQWAKPIRSISISGSGLSGGEIYQIESFYNSRNGSGLPFYWEDVRPVDDGGTKASRVTDEVLGTGDNSETNFSYQRTYVHNSSVFAVDTNYIKPSTTTVYLDDVVQSSGYTNHIEKSSASDDARILFTSPPGNNVVVKVDYTELIKVHFITDTLDINNVGFGIYEYSIQMEEISD